MRLSPRFSSGGRLAALTASTVVLSLTAAAFADSSLDAPVVRSIEGGLTALNFTPTASGLSAYPLISPPANGFAAKVVVSLTDKQGPDDLSFYAIKTTTRTGNLLPTTGGGEYTYLATLDSGGQSHILSADDAAAIDLFSAGRNGGYTVDVVGASGSESLDVSDPLGVFVAGVNPVANANPLLPAASAYKGQIHTSVLTAQEGSILPSIIGVPMFAQYAVTIRNSQTYRIQTPSGPVRTPSVEFANLNAGAAQPLKLVLDLQDPSNSASGAPAFFPSFESFEDFSDNPAAPTFWAFPMAKANLSHTGGSLTQQPFLFDTGAQITVLSEETADAIGFDVGVDEADFTVDIQGVGGISQAKGFFINQLELPVTGGSAIFTDVPVVILNVTDPRDGIGFVPGIIGMNLFTDRDLTVNLSTSDPYVKFSQPITPQWKLNGSSSWSTDANWDLGVPDGADLPANFLGAITSATTVSISEAFTIGSMKFDNANSYTLSGSGALTFSVLGRAGKVEVLQGNHTVNVPVTFNASTAVSIAHGQSSQTINVNSGAVLTFAGDSESLDADVAKSGTGQLRLKNARYQSLTITAGSVQLLSSTSTTDGNVVESLSISSGATLDLTNRPLAIDYTSASPIATVRGHLLAGRILSSAANGNSTVGYGETSALGLTSFGGVNVDGTTIVMKLVRRGDSNLSGTVNFDDLLALAQHYGLSTNQVWTTGDFDYTGGVDFNDLLMLAQNYGGSLLSGNEIAALDANFAADWALAQSLVPEPTVALGLLALTLGRRRR